MRKVICNSLLVIGCVITQAGWAGVPLKAKAIANHATVLIEIDGVTQVLADPVQSDAKPSAILFVDKAGYTQDRAPKPALRAGISTSPVAAADTMRLINYKAQEHGINSDLIYALIRQESAFRADAISSKGAIGLMQVMPATGRRFGVTNLYDPERNLEAGMKYLVFLNRLFSGNLELVLAAYNAGEGAVQRYNYKIPPFAETQDYVRRIVAHLDLMNSR